jgi:beta-lactamase regulating signal transducer with metallopeptidase domain/protocatechuate 3,4-dioxygenase beta subunit
MNRVLMQVSDWNQLDHLAYVLVHSLWQAGFCAVGLWLALRCLSARRTNARYALCTVAMLGVLLGMLSTWSILNFARSSETADVAFTAAQPERMAEPGAFLAQPSDAQAETAVQDREQETSAPPIGLRSASSRLEPSGTVTAGREASQSVQSADWRMWLVLLWMIGAAGMLFRVVHAVLASNRLMKGGRPAEASLANIVDGLQQQLGIAQQVRVVICDRVDIPAVLGLWWPTLLLPSSLLTGVPADQLRVVIAHELAHIRRRDYLINLLQMLVEAVLFFNPGVWWISRQMRIEREACCDALAVDITGQPLAVARTLVDFAGRLQSANPLPMAASALGRSEDSRRGGPLFDRIRRIVTPGERPQVRLPWYSLLAVLAVGLIASAGLHQGTKIVVTAAAEWLPPRDHVQKLVDIQETHGPKETPRRNYGPEDAITISGRVRTADGKPLPEKLYLRGASDRPGYGTSLNVFCDEQHRFSQRIEFGKIFLTAQVPGYAPPLVGPLEAEPGGKIEDIDIVLDQGFVGRLRVTDLDGHGIAGAELKAWHLLGIGGSGLYANTRTVTTDLDALAVFEHCADYPLHVEVRTAGYQYERREFRLSPDEILTWRLSPAQPTTGQVLAAQSNKPIGGAQLKLVKREGHNNTTSDPRQRSTSNPLLATTDADGQFRLDTLRNDSKYAIYVTAPEYGGQLVYPVHAGQKNVRIELGPPLSIRGKLVGPLGVLPQRGRGADRHPYFRYRNPLVFENSSYNETFYAKVEIRPDGGYFEITDLLPGKVRMTPPGKTVELDVTKSIDDLVIDLNVIDERKDTDGKPTARRTVEIRLQVDEGAPPAAGELQIASSSATGQRHYELQHADIVDGKARIDVPMPSKLRIDTKGVIGYLAKKQSNIEVAEGDEPLVIDIPTIPAGAIYGRVLNADGTPCESIHLTVYTIEKAPRLQEPFPPISYGDFRDKTGRFLITPLPLGGTYRLLAGSSESGHAGRLLSGLLTLDNENSAFELEMQLPEGITLNGEVLDPDGNPVAGAALSLSHAPGIQSELSQSHGSSETFATTDAAGRFQFEHVNPDMPGEYFLNVRPSTAFQGLRQAVDLNAKTQKLRLERGVTTAGVVLDVDTGEPLGNVVVWAWPADFSKSAWWASLETKTDAQGRFRFRGMEPIRYRVGIRGVLPPDVVIHKEADGRYRYEYPSGYPGWSITGGEQESVTLRAKRRPREE